MPNLGIQNFNVNLTPGTSNISNVATAQGANFAWAIVGWELVCGNIAGNGSITGNGAVLKIQDSNATPTVMATLSATTVVGGGSVKTPGTRDSGMVGVGNTGIDLLRSGNAGVSITGYLTLDLRKTPGT